MKSVTLSGRIGLTTCPDLGSPVRDVHFETTTPYNHTVIITVSADTGAADEQSFVDALRPAAEAGLVEVTADITDVGDLVASPSRFKIIA